MRHPQQIREIPTVEIPSSRSDFSTELVETIGRAMEQIGFLFVRAPYIAKILPEIYAQFRAFFELSPEDRMKYAHPEIDYQRGYTPGRQEEGLFCRPNGSNSIKGPDLKHCFMMGPPPEAYRGVVIPEEWASFHQPNVWPVEVPDFQGAMEFLYSLLYPVGQDVLRVLETVLEKPSGFFDDALYGGPTAMRSLYYPPISAEEIGKVVWGCPHTDINLVTVLPGSTKSGLWIRLRGSTESIPGAAPEGCVLVQTGDMLRRLTGDRMTSAVHEVRAPSEPTIEGRYSAALFMHPRSDFVLRERDGLLAGQFLKSRLRSIGLAKKKSNN